MLRPATVLLLFVAAVALAACGGAGSAARPNVILVTIDTLRADRLGCYGYDGAATPLIDSLAGEGTRFEQVVAPAPLTAPSHATILTGRVPLAHGVRHNALFRLPEGETTLAEAFRDAGYRTGAVLAAAVLNSEYGLDQGFEHYDDVSLGRVRQGLPAERTSTEVTERALAWLRGGDERPTFLWVHYFDPHHPYAPPERFRSGFADPYDGEVAAVDASLRQLIKAFPELGLEAEKTVIAITSDHGEALGEHGERTHGFFAYQATLRVPLVLYGPGRVARGEVVREPAGLVDLAPTLLGLAGLSSPADLDGQDLLDGETEAGGRTLYFETRAPLLDHGWAPLAGFRRDDLTYILAPRPEIYDLASDPGELRNHAADRPEEEARLRREVERLVALREGASMERVVGAEEAEALRGLGYVAGTAAGGAVPAGDLLALPDPKDRVEEMRATFEALNLLGEKRPREAVRALEDALARDPGNATAAVLMTQALVADGRPEEAAQVIDRALNRATELGLPGEVIGLFLQLRGRYLLAAGRPDEAVASIRESEREVPLGRDTILLLAEAEMKAGRPDAARKVYTRALVRAPGDADILHAAAEHAARTGRDDEAWELATRALAAAPAPAPRTELLLGNLELDAGRPGEARARFERILARWPKATPARFGLARALRESGDLDGAAPLLDELLRVSPRDAALRFERARLRLDRGDAAGARRDLEETLSLDPGMEEASRLLATLP